MRIVLLGPPASGKGTQGRRLAASLQLDYLSTGSLLREAMENDTPLGRLARPILDVGGYLPDDLMCGILGEWLDQHPGGWVLDGFPRSIPQAAYLDQRLTAAGLALNAVVALDVPFDELLARSTQRVECPDCRWSGPVPAAPGGACPTCASTVAPREDDDPALFRARFRAYETHVMPLLDYYAGRGILFRCDASPPPDAVAATIRNRFP